MNKEQKTVLVNVKGFYTVEQMTALETEFNRIYQGYKIKIMLPAIFREPGTKREYVRRFWICIFDP